VGKSKIFYSMHDKFKFLLFDWIYRV